MKLLGRTIEFRIHKTEILLGTIMVLISIILPSFLLSENLRIYDSLENSIDLWDKEYLLYAAFDMIVLQTIKSFPVFFSVFLLMDSVEIKINGRLRNTLKIIFGIITIQIIYFIIYQIYYDMEYYFGKVSILEMVYLMFHTSNRFKKISLAKRNVVLFFIFTGIQWLDVTKYFSILDYKNTGELFFDLKNISLLMEADKILNLIGFLFFICFIIFSLTLLFIFFDQERKETMYEKENEVIKVTTNLRLQEIENRYLKEIQYLVHDLKTPLFSISTLIEILNLQERDEEKKEYYARIEKSLEKCNIMISEILRDSCKNYMDVKKLFTFMFSCLSAHKCINFLTYNNYCNNVKIKVNKIVFSRAIINLIVNGYEASQDVDKRIKITVKDYMKFLLIKVEDFGKGMSPDELKNIFINGYSTKLSSGMGLNFVQTVMNEHNCKLVINSKVGTGTQVYIIVKGEILKHEK